MLAISDLEKKKEFYYLHSKNNGVDQQRSNRAANLHLLVCLCEKQLLL